MICGGYGRCRTCTHDAHDAIRAAAEPQPPTGRIEVDPYSSQRHTWEHLRAWNAVSQRQADMLADFLRQALDTPGRHG